MQVDEQFMQRCIQLAELGRGRVEPNPLVGAVIVHQNKIIGEGYHQKYGEAHAEVNAINSVVDQSLLQDATIYVSLEPCSHFGKTPPCSDLIIQSGIKQVVIGAKDPNPQVNGSGIEKLKEAGLEVITNVLEDECIFQNRRFYTYYYKKRPFVFLKWAQTENGFVDDNGKQSWISAAEVKPIVHEWRNQNQAILVGKTTVERDNPALTVREFSGQNPIRVIIDPECELSGNLKVLDGAVETIILNQKRESSEDKIKYIKLENLGVADILKKLYEMEIQSVMVEGGSYTLSQFIQEELWDEAKVIVAPSEISNGTKAPVIDITPLSIETIVNNQIYHYLHT